MTYHGRRRPALMGLGALPVEPSAAEGEDSRFDRWWDFIPIARMRDLTPTFTALHSGGGLWASGQFNEEREPVAGLKTLWVRLGRRPAWWPGASGEFNFGPTTHMPGWGGEGHALGNNTNAIRINREFRGLLDQLTASVSAAVAEARASGRLAPYFPRGLWIPSSDGYVHLRVDDPLLEQIRLRRMVPGSLMEPFERVSVKDDSSFVRGLYRIYLERLRALRQANPNAQLKDDRGRDWWPGGFNFGPNTNGNEVRIHPGFLDYLLNEPTEREKAASRAIAGMEVKPPVFGGLPSLRPGAKPLWLQPTVSLARNKVAVATQASTLSPEIAKAAATIDWGARLKAALENK